MSKAQLSSSKERPSPLSSTSQIPTALLTPAQARLALIDKVLGKKADIVPKSTTADRRHALQTAQKKKKFQGQEESAHRTPGEQ